jgi:hypothetical protein
MVLISGTSYTLTSTFNGVRDGVIMQTVLNGGTAQFFIRVNGSSTWSKVCDLTDTPEIIRIPYLGTYKVELTGTATVSTEWG